MSLSFEDMLADLENRPAPKRQAVEAQPDALGDLGEYVVEASTRSSLDEETDSVEYTGRFGRLSLRLMDVVKNLNTLFGVYTAQDTGEVGFANADTIFSTHPPTLGKQLSVYTDLAQEYEDILAPEAEAAEAVYRVTFGRSRTKIAYSVKSTIQRDIKYLKMYFFSARAVVRKASTQHNVTRKAKGAVATQLYFVRTPQAEMTYEYTSIKRLTEMFGAGTTHGYTDEDAEQGLSLDEPIIYKPQNQRAFKYGKLGAAGKYGALTRAYSLIDVAGNGEISKGMIVLYEVAKDVYALEDGQQRLTTFRLLFTDSIPARTDEVNGKKVPMYFSGLLEEDRQYLENIRFPVEIVRFNDGVPFSHKDVRARQAFVAINNAGTKLTDGEINVSRMVYSQAVIISAIADSREVKTVLGPYISDTNSELRSFLIRVIVMSLDRNKISNDLSEKIWDTVSLIEDWDAVSKNLKTAVEFCGACSAQFAATTRFSKPVTETFVASILQALHLGLIDREALFELRLEAQGAHRVLLQNPGYAKITYEGINNQGSIERKMEDGTWAGRYPMFFQGVLEKVYGVPFDSVYG